MSSNSKLERVFKTNAGVPYAGHPVTVTEANSNTWVRLYTPEGVLVSSNGETSTDSSGRVSVFVNNDRKYELTLRQKVTRVPILVLREEEASPEDIRVDYPSSFPSGNISERSHSFSALQDGAQLITLNQSQEQINSGHRLSINGLLQAKDSYSVTTSSITIPSSLNVIVGDSVTFGYFLIS